MHKMSIKQLCLQETNGQAASTESFHCSVMVTLQKTLGA